MVYLLTELGPAGTNGLHVCLHSLRHDVVVYQRPPELLQSWQPRLWVVPNIVLQVLIYQTILDFNERFKKIYIVKDWFWPTTNIYKLCQLLVIWITSCCTDEVCYKLKFVLNFPHKVLTSNKRLAFQRICWIARGHSPMLQ